MTNNNKKKTQSERVLNVLQKANGGYVNGRYFNNTMMISQYHARIKELQEKDYPIIASKFTDEFGFKSYRLAQETDKKVVTFNKEKRLETLRQEPLFNCKPNHHNF